MSTRIRSLVPLREVVRLELAPHDANRRDTRRADALRSLRGVILLAGAVRPTGLQAQIRRSALDLPLPDGRSILEGWRSPCTSLATQLGLAEINVRVVTGRAAARPETGRGDGPVRFLIEHDPRDFRGTGGVIRDLAVDYRDEEYLLVANAAQLLQADLAKVVIRLAETGADAALTSNDDGTPGGLLLIRCGCLREVPSVGFVDLKEQALPAIAKKHQVVVLHQQLPVGLPVRTLGEYIAAARARSLGDAGSDVALAAYREDWRSSFSIVQDAGTVHPSARIHDSVVLRGARVEAGAVVVRSVVCPGGVVRKGQPAIDQVVAAASAGRPSRKS